MSPSNDPDVLRNDGGAWTQPGGLLGLISRSRPAPRRLVPWDKIRVRYASRALGWALRLTPGCDSSIALPQQVVDVSTSATSMVNRAHGRILCALPRRPQSQTDAFQLARSSTRSRISLPKRSAGTSLISSRL